MVYRKLLKACRVRRNKSKTENQFLHDLKNYLQFDSFVLEFTTLHPNGC
jgi:hypothetical protein